jgi:hypothetical protein
MNLYFEIPNLSSELIKIDNGKIKENIKSI